MEQRLYPIAQKLEEQYRLYQESKCDSTEADAGCATLKRSMVEGYMVFLDELLGSLPRIEHAMTNIKNAVGGRIVRDDGKPHDPSRSAADAQ